MTSLAQEMTAFDIVSLSKCPRFIETCAAWSFGEWGCLRSGADFRQLLEKVKNSASGAGLPECWVGIYDGRPAGMITLKKTEHPDRTDLSPWLGGLYVHPCFRGRGLAKRLCEHLENEARETHRFEQAYLQTSLPDFYEKMAWEDIGIVRDTIGLYPGGVTLMKKVLCPL